MSPARPRTTSTAAGHRDVWARPGLHVLICAAVLGLALDVWSHAATERADTFFSVWHLPLYGSVSLVALVVLRDRLRDGLRRDHLGDVGLVTLALGGATDALWHEIAGVEETIEGFFSISHLLVFAGLTLLALAPLQVELGDRAGRRGPLLVATVTAAAVTVSVATMWATPFARQPGLRGAEAWFVAGGMASWIVQSAVLGALIGVTVRMWPDHALPPAAAAGAWWSTVALVGGRPRQALVALVIVGSVGALHLVARRQPRSRGASIVAGGAAGSACLAWFVAAEALGETAWSSHLVSGAIAWSVLTAAGVARLLGDRLPPGRSEGTPAPLERTTA